MTRTACPSFECDGALAPQRHFGTVDAIDPDQVFRVGRTQGAFEARHEFLVERQRSECVGRTALRLVEHVALAIGQDDLERASALAHGLHLLSDGPREMRDETGQQAREKRGRVSHPSRKSSSRDDRSRHPERGAEYALSMRTIASAVVLLLTAAVPAFAQTTGSSRRYSNGPT